MDYPHEQDRRLIEALVRLRSAHGLDAADDAVATLIECLKFVSESGHGNISLAVRDHHISRRVRFEYFTNAGAG
jgi:hypothetical protein